MRNEFILISFRKFLHLLLAGVLSLLLSVAASEAFAQNRKKAKKVSTKHLNLPLSFLENDVHDFDLQAEINEVITSGADTSLYDTLTVESLRRLKEEAQPSYNPEDIDPERTRRIVTKAFTIQSMRSLSKLIQSSELSPFYRSIRSRIKELQSSVRYSVQDSGDSLTVSREKQGRRLLELNLELNSRQILDPQITIGDALRFRFDYVEKAPLLEYQFNF